MAEEPAHWSLHLPTRLVFGIDALMRLPDMAGQRLLLVTTPGFVRRGVADKVRAIMGDRIVHVHDDVQPNPDLDHLDRSAAALKPLELDGIVALGGGSVMDSAKALAMLLGGDPALSMDSHLRGGLPAPERALPIIAVPTTAGTGSEVTPFATVWDHAASKKYSIVGPHLRPQVALLDPKLTLGLPPEVTISTALDAISQAFESYWGRASNAVTEAWAVHAFRLGLESLPRIVADPDNLADRGHMMEASLLAGMAISHTRTAIAHSISYPVTARFGLPHGFACSFTLPAILQFNAELFPERAATLAHAVGEPDVAALVRRLLDLFAAVDLRSWMAAYVPSIDDLKPFIPEMITPGRADNNMRPVTLRDVETLLDQSKRIAHFA